MKTSILAAATLIILSLSACAGPITMAPQASSPDIARETLWQQQLVYQKYIEDQDRLFNISFPLKAANADFCGPKRAPLLGMSAWNIYSVGKTYREAAFSIYNLKDRLAVQSVAKRSPAARAGIQSGDILISVNGQSIPSGATALKDADRLFDMAGYRPSDVMIERNGNLMSKVVTPTEGCDFPVILDNKSAEINAYADGSKIVVSKGILRFTENDNELALVIAHELGHSALSHVNKMKQNAAAGMLGGLAIDSIFAAAGVGTGGQFSQMGGQMGVSHYSVAFEQEADYVGMYFMERAGYDSSGAANFWRRMAAEGATSVNRRTSHPASPERFLAIERAHDEIRVKKARKQPLVPNLIQ